MTASTKIQLLHNGKLVNKHSDGGTRHGWHNPIDVLPPIGSVIEYITTNKRNKKKQAVLTGYRVKSYTFTTEEDVNHTYRNKICKIEVERLYNIDMHSPMMQIIVGVLILLIVWLATSH